MRPADGRCTMCRDYLDQKAYCKRCKYSFRSEPPERVREPKEGWEAWFASYLFNMHDPQASVRASAEDLARRVRGVLAQDVERVSKRDTVERLREPVAHSADAAFEGRLRAPVDPPSSTRPVCEECDEEMHPYDTEQGKSGWCCDVCGWSWDDDLDPESSRSVDPPDPEALREALERFVDPEAWACSGNDRVLCEHCDYSHEGFDGKHDPECPVDQARRALAQHVGGEG